MIGEKRGTSLITLINPFKEPYYIQPYIIGQGLGRAYIYIYSTVSDRDSAKIGGPGACQAVPGRPFLPWIRNWPNSCFRRQNWPSSWFWHQKMVKFVVPASKLSKFVVSASKISQIRGSGIKISQICGSGVQNYSDSWSRRPKLAKFVVPTSKIRQIPCPSVRN